MRKWIGRGVLAVVALGLLALLVYGYLPKPLPVEVAQVAQGPLESAIEEEGKTRVEDRYTLYAPVAGDAERITLRPGARVQAGQTVVTIAPLRSPLLDPQARATAESRLSAALDAKRQADAAVARAQTALDQAQRDLARAQQLFAARATTRQNEERAEFALRARQTELVSARFTAQVAGHEIQVARAALASYRNPTGERVPVTAPVGGEVLKVQHESEGPVTPGTPLIEIGDLNSLEVAVETLTRDAVQLAPGMPARIERWGGGQPLQGVVRRVEPSAFTKVSPLGVEEQRVNVIVALDDPPAEREKLGDQYAVDVRFITWSSPRVLTVPTSALFRDGTRWAAFVVKNGRAKLRHVELGHRSATQAEVLGGLSADETVVIHPSDALRDGARVQFR